LTLSSLFLHDSDSPTPLFFVVVDKKIKEAKMMRKSRASRKALELMGMAALVMLCLMLGHEKSVYALGTTYYVDSVSGNNGNSGTSTASPWQDFTNVNSTTFQPGDQILLKSGSTWTMGMTPHGSGTSTDWITIGSYGTGNKPIIDGSGSGFNGISLSDQSYWKIDNIEFTHCLNGIYAEYTPDGKEGLEFTNLYMHDSFDTSQQNSYAVKVALPSGGSPTQGVYTIRDITIINVYSLRARGLRFDGHEKWDIQDVTVKNFTVEQAGRGAWGFVGVTNALLLDSYEHHNNTIAKSNGTASSYFWKVKDVKFVNSDLMYTADTDSVDQTANDHEAFTDSSIFRGNYIAENAGPGIEFLGLVGRTGDYSKNHLIEHNAFYHNGTGGNASYVGALKFLNNSNLGSSNWSGTAQNNMYYDDFGFTKGTVESGWTLANNYSVNAGDMYNTSYGFSGLQGGNYWNYQYWNGSSWVDLSYDNATETWGDSTDGMVTRFNLWPANNSSQWTARTWTAPTDGTIRITGWVLKNQIGGGDGVKVKIVKNSTTIWPTSGSDYTLAATDQTGVNTSIGNIFVSAGDKIRFEVNRNTNNNFDKTSWNPTIAYEPFDDHFEDGDAAGWMTNGGTWSVVQDGTKMYKQSATTGNSYSSTGNSDWTDYTYIAKVKPISFTDSTSGVGILARYADSSNYYNFKYTNGELQISKKVGGSTSVLDEENYTVNTGTTYTFKAVVNGSSLQFYVNGALELSATDSGLTSGKVALFTNDATAEFDDISIEKPVTLASDNFEDGNASGWTTNGGTWSVAQDGTEMYKQANASGTYTSSIGDSGWTDYTVQAKVKPLSFNGSTGSVGIRSRYTSDSNFYNFRYQDGQLQILKRVSDVSTVLIEKAYTLNTGTTYTFKASVKGNSLQFYVNGNLELSDTDSSLTTGNSALALNNATAEFDDVLIQ
jgi:hypothetical protein